MPAARLAKKNGAWIVALLMSAACSPPPSADVREKLNAGMTLVSSCSGCHGARSGQAIKSLQEIATAGVEAKLLAYKRDESGQTVMHRIARGFTETEIARLAAFLEPSPQPPLEQ